MDQQRPHDLLGIPVGEVLCVQQPDCREPCAQGDDRAGEDGDPAEEMIRRRIADEVTAAREKPIPEEQEEEGESGEMNEES